MIDNYLGINIDYSRDSLFDQLGLQRLKESYMREDETSPQQRYAFVSKQFSSDPEHAQRLYDYSSKHWLSFSTPILSFGRSKGGLPISCFLAFIDDTAEGLVENLSETNWLSMMGGGVGIGFGIRSADGRSTGVMAHAKTYDASSLAYRQGSTRRGSYALYLDISHPDIVNFIEMRKPTGDPNIRCLNLHHGVNISDEFMEIIERCMQDDDADDSWELKDPHSGEVREVISAKELWMLLLETRMQRGEPYIHFIDTSNRSLPEFQKNLGLKIQQSNLCSEIYLPTNKDRTAVCCLSSLNLARYDEWKDNPIFIRDVLEMLDNVLQYFIDNAPDSISRAKYSAYRERSVGLGTLGFHSYLQKNGIAIESAKAKGVNIRIFKNIKKKIDAANLELGMLRGEAPDAVGTGKRCSLTMAIAPNASTSLICGNISASIEPVPANAYRQDTLSGFYTNKNRFLDDIIKEEAKNHPDTWYDEQWSSIIMHDGSVQHLKWLSDEHKKVYKTSFEINQLTLVELAGDRQNFIDQGQSFNVFIRPSASIPYIHAIHFKAWKEGLKGMYYTRSEKAAKADKIAKKIEREIIKDFDMKSLVDDDECVACEG